MSKEVPAKTSVPPKKKCAGADGLVKVEIPNTAGYTQLPTSENAADPVEEELPWAEALLEDTIFQAAMGSLIMANALVIGLETDIKWVHWDFVENLFLFLFSCELFFKLVVLGPVRFFAWTNPDLHWNSFDFFIVSLGLFDFTMTHLGASKGSGGFSTIFRMIRLLRILRIFRIIKFLKQLYLLAFGLVEATKAIFWVAILMCFVLYVTSIVIVKTIGRPPKSDVHYDFLNYHFGTIIDSMLTLFVLMSSPNLPVYQDEVGLLAEKPFFCLFLVMFITFGSFGIIAMLTGVISESMFEKNEMRKEEQRHEHEDIRNALGAHAETLFSGLKVNGNGDAAVADVLTLAPDMVALMESAGGSISPMDAVRMINSMDTDGGGTVGVEEFVETIEKIAEGLSPLSLQEVHHEIAKVHGEIAKVWGKLDEMMGVMEKIACGPSDTEAGLNCPELPQPAAGAGVHKHADLDSIATLLSQHTSSVHSELARQCKELHSKLHSMATQASADVLSAAHGSRPEIVPEIATITVPTLPLLTMPEVPSGIDRSNAEFLIWSDREVPSQAVGKKGQSNGEGCASAAALMNPSATQNHPTVPTNFSTAAQAAALRLGLMTPELMAERTADRRQGRAQTESSATAVRRQQDNPCLLST